MAVMFFWTVSELIHIDFLLWVIKSDCLLTRKALIEAVKSALLNVRFCEVTERHTLFFRIFLLIIM